ncbi:hypothetical protein OUZ56_001307 [Daphnia magna]|uniref:Uncharacterized protein n=1 Tax=Daphnia magna TaxID=35525 RepID=A0ABR0A289_9CRUS|nr:hypothetical protein OUZ56_001307 [Daphnia magna]
MVSKSAFHSMTYQRPPKAQKYFFGTGGRDRGEGQSILVYNALKMCNETAYPIIIINGTCTVHSIQTLPRCATMDVTRAPYANEVKSSGLPAL